MEISDFIKGFAKEENKAEAREKLKQFLEDTKESITILSNNSDPYLYDNRGMTQNYYNLLNKGGTIIFMTDKEGFIESEIEQAIEIENLNLYGIKISSEFKDNLKIKWLISPEPRDIIIKDNNRIMTIDHFFPKKINYINNKKEVHNYLNRMNEYFSHAIELDIK